MDDGSLEAQVSAHFGRAPNYTLYDPGEETVEIVTNDGKHHGGSRSPPNAIAETGADVLVCGNLGRKAVDKFDDLDIEVYCGAKGTVEDAIRQWRDGELEAAVPGGEYCGHDHDHEHEHGHGHDHDHDHEHE